MRRLSSGLSFLLCISVSSASFAFPEYNHIMWIDLSNRPDNPARQEVAAVNALIEAAIVDEVERNISGLEKFEAEAQQRSETTIAEKNQVESLDTDIKSKLNELKPDLERFKATNEAFSDQYGELGTAYQQLPSLSGVVAAQEEYNQANKTAEHWAGELSALENDAEMLAPEIIGAANQLENVGADRALAKFFLVYYSVSLKGNT